MAGGTAPEYGQYAERVVSDGLDGATLRLYDSVDEEHTHAQIQPVMLTTLTCNACLQL